MAAALGKIPIIGTAIKGGSKLVSTIGNGITSLFGNRKGTDTAHKVFNSIGEWGGKIGDTMSGAGGIINKAKSGDWGGALQEGSDVVKKNLFGKKQAKQSV